MHFKENFKLHWTGHQFIDISLKHFRNISVTLLPKFKVIINIIYKGIEFTNGIYKDITNRFL